MNDLNSILIEGRIVNDAVLDKPEKDLYVCTFTIASTRYHKAKSGMEKETGYFEIQAFGKLAEASRDQAYQGRCVRVVGRLKQEPMFNWNGSPHSKYVIAAEHIEYRSECNADKVSRRPDYE
jgi:single-strand DNA-binding protein